MSAAGAASHGWRAAGGPRAGRGERRRGGHRRSRRSDWSSHSCWAARTSAARQRLWRTSRPNSLASIGRTRARRRLRVCSERGVRGVFAVADLLAGGVGFDVGAPDAEPWAEDLERDPVDLPDGAGAHAAKAGAAAAEEIEEEGLDLIIRVMGEEERCGSGSGGRPRRRRSSGPGGRRSQWRACASRARAATSARPVMTGRRQAAGERLDETRHRRRRPSRGGRDRDEAR